MMTEYGTMTGLDMKLSIVVPAHNEEARIGKMLASYLPYFSERFGDDMEMIVVVNGSTDRTEELVREQCKEYPILKCIVEPAAIGKGGAVVRGFTTAQGDLIGFCDADGATPPEAFNDLVEQIGNNDVIVASRWCRGAQVSPKQPLARRIASRGFNMLTRLLFGLKLSDTQCGAKLMKKETVKAILPHLGITQWAFDVDLLFQSKRLKYSIREIPTIWHDVAGSKIAALAHTSFDMFLALGRLRLMHSPFRFVVGLYDRFLAPIVRPEGMESDRLIRHSMVIMAGSQVSNVLNMVFQFAMVKLLSDAQYGVMGAMLGVFLIASAPVAALSRALTHFSAGFAKDDKRGQIWPMLSAAIRDVLPVAIISFVLVFSFRAKIAGFFQLESTLPVMITGVAFALFLFSPLMSAVLQGLQAFFWTTSISVAGTVFRITLAVILVLIGLGADGVLLAYTAALVFVLLLGFVGVRNVLAEGGRRPRRADGFYVYMSLYVLPLLCYMVLSLADVAIVKHYFEQDIAGRFAKTAMLPRAVIFLPQPIVMAMFPKVVSRGKASYQSGRTLLKALFLTLILLLSLAMVCLVFAGPLTRALVGDQYAEMVYVFRGMVLALVPVSIIFVLMNFEFAQRRFIVTVPLLAAAAIYGVGTRLWHKELLDIVVVLAAASTIGMLGCIACMPWKSLGSEKV